MGIFFKTNSEKLYNLRRKIITNDREFKILRRPKTLEAYKEDGSYKISLMLLDRLGGVSETHTVGSEIEFKALYEIGLEYFGDQLKRPPSIYEDQNEKKFSFSGKLESTFFSLNALLDFNIRDGLCSNYVQARKLQIIASGGQININSAETGFKVTSKDEGHLEVIIQDGVVIETKTSFTLENYNQSKKDLEADLNHSPVRILKEHEEVATLKWDDIHIDRTPVRFILKMVH